MVAATPCDGSVVGGYVDLPGLRHDDHVGLDVSSSSYYTNDQEEEEETPTSMDQWNTADGPDIEHGLDLIETNIKFQQVKKHYEDSLVLNLLVRATPTVSSGFVSEGNINHRVDESAAVLYQPPLVYDLSEHGVLDVDDHGVFFQSQGSNISSTIQPTQHTAMCTQESRNVSKGKLKVVFEEEDEEKYNSSDEEIAYDSDNNPFSMEQHMIDEA
ncbi:hypothetical protein D1007_11497 [Hordeum vulgare]|nr:hypothetical protein D1007_11497 [Hordeum vulgare]